MPGCSRKISYRDAYKFDRHHYAIKDIENVRPPAVEQPLDDQLTASTKTLLNIESSVKMPSISRRRLAAALALSSKAARAEHRPDTTTGPETTDKPKPNPALNAKAKAGFYVTLISLLLLPATFLFLIPLAIGLGLCVVGLKSEKRNLALLGIWGTIIYAAILLFFVIVFSGTELDI